ncbi:MAG: hypothetical protein LEGION0398_MBIBDBAK_00157 [Legionellaceae bacterium]
MEKEMSSFHARVDKDFYNIILKKAKERNIKVTRYIRMLLERGLVVDEYYHGERDSLEIPNVGSQSLIKAIANLSAETTMLARLIYRNQFEDSDDFIDEINKVYKKSQRLLEESISMEKE